MEAFSGRGKTHLLTLPRDDLIIRENMISSVATPPSKQHKEKFLMIEMPEEWSVEDFSDCQFVATGDQQVALISSDQSFHLTKVETSNVLVLLPASQSAESNYAAEESPNKRQKSDLNTTTARLLNPGGSGASFLLMNPRVLPLFDLRKLLPTWEATSSSVATTKSTIQLAHQLQVSEAQLRRGLLKLNAYEYKENEWVLVGPVTREILNRAVLETLMEEEELLDDSMQVNLEQSIVGIEERAQTGISRHLMRHGLEYFCDGLSPNGGSTLQLSFAKLAQYVARTLLEKQTTPWERELFVSRWQTEVPGVCKVDDSMLEGIAILEEEEYWRHFDCQSLAVETYFASLFEARAEWKKEDLQVYMKYYQDGVGLSDDSLWIRYTRTKGDMVVART